MNPSGFADPAVPAASATSRRPTVPVATGSAGSVASPADDRGPQAPLRRTLALARPVAGRLTLATLLGAGAVAAAIGLIATSAWLISRSSQHPQESAVAIAIVGVQFFALSRGLCRYGERLIGHDAAFRVLADLRVRIYERLERLAPLGLPAFRSGELLARLVHDVDSLQDLLLRVVPPFAIALFVGAATVGLVWWMLPAAGAILLVALLLAGVLVPWLTGTLAARAEARQAAARGELTASVVDLIEGAPELLVNGATAAQLSRALAADAEVTKIASATARTAGVGQGLSTLCAGLAMWGALLVGVAAVRAGTLNGVLLAGIALIPLVAFELVSGLPTAIQTLQRVRRSAARVFEVIDAPPPVVEPAHPVALPLSPTLATGTQPAAAPASQLNGQTAVEADAVGTTRGHVLPASQGHVLRVRGLRSRYPGATRWALDGIDLDLAPGRRIAVVGPSGAGKSTLAGVLLRFLPYESGSATLDGVEIAELDGEECRRVVGLVAQDAHIFDNTIEENLRLAQREATAEELREVLAKVRLLDWVQQLPEGLGTAVGERGARMSGGQRQRLAIARALLADFPILILDEPGEHLDTETADAILADVLALTRERAILLITHRRTDLAEMDAVLTLDHGVARA
ncbi:MAG TPA: thiol reductant ABC exporter subunit CydC [Solirubrobacteraceae bacterium]|nr:thiol reductant ABC exporter subunit CydC [Solirubrobacteraceae bacterium]